MNQIGEKEFRDAIIATKKDAKLVASARNDRLNTTEYMYREFTKLPIDRQREIIAAISADQFVAAQWKIVFPLNNFPASAMPNAVSAIGKALFFTREEDSVRETVRAVRLYQESPFLGTIANVLGEAAEIAGAQLSAVAEVLTVPELFGIIRSLEFTPASEKLVSTIGRTAMYTRDERATLAVTKFLLARLQSPHLDALTSVLENSIFLARDRKSVGEILSGLNRGSIDVVLEREGAKKEVLSAIGDVAWKTRDARAIGDYLQSYLS